RVFSGKPVEVMPATPGMTDARDWMRAKLTEYGESYETVKELPFDIDASQVTDMSYMFNECNALTTVPDMDTSQVTDMCCMFQDCYALTLVPDMDTSQVTDVSYMFFDCAKLTDGNVRLIGKYRRVTTKLMIWKSGLTREPFYDSSGQPI